MIYSILMRHLVWLMFLTRSSVKIIYVITAMDVSECSNRDRTSA